MFQSPPPPPDYINETTLATFGVATAAILAVSVVFRKVFKVNHLIVPLITSLAISFALAANQHTLGKPIGWLIALLNTALLFCAGVGMNETVAGAGQMTVVGGQKQQGKRPEGPRPSQPAFKSFFSHGGQLDTGTS
jgi:hypothetical protein